MIYIVEQKTTDSDNWKPMTFPGGSIAAYERESYASYAAKWNSEAPANSGTKFRVTPVEYNTHE
jgi:hypothetical protein